MTNIFEIAIDYLTQAHSDLRQPVGTEAHEARARLIEACADLVFEVSGQVPVCNLIDIARETLPVEKQP